MSRRSLALPSLLATRYLFFLCLFLRRRFLRLWVDILCLFLFLPLGIVFEFLIRKNVLIPAGVCLCFGWFFRLVGASPLSAHRLLFPLFIAPPLVHRLLPPPSCSPPSCSSPSCSLSLLLNAPYSGPLFGPLLAVTF